MKFIIPQNYSYKNKLFGFIDYSTLFLNLIWYAFVFCILDLLFNNLTTKISLFIIFCLPLFIFSIVGFNHENFVYFLSYLIKYLISPKIYFYNKL